MLINMVLPGAAGSAEEPFAFEYSGNFTDNRVDGIGTVRLNTSGTLVTTGQTVKVTVYILAGGGGAAYSSRSSRTASGGGGGNQTIEVELTPGTYEIVIGTGGTELNTSGTGTAGAGGNTTAFDKTSTGGTGGTTGTNASTTIAGVGGSPNGGNGSTNYNTTAAGGAPNGGTANKNDPQPGGDGYVDLTFS